MGRNSYNPNGGYMENNHEKNQMIRDAARTAGISEQRLSEEVHCVKDSWYNGDFTYAELLKIAFEIKEGKR